MTEQQAEQQVEKHDEPQEQQVAVPMPVMQFEGEYITESEGRMAAFTFEMPEGYARGTILRFAIEARVKSVQYNEDRKGDLARVHMMSVNQVGITAAFRPEQRRDDIEGDATPYAVPDTETNQALGVQLGRTADQWGRPEEPEPDAQSEVGESAEPDAEPSAETTETTETVEAEQQHAVGF